MPDWLETLSDEDRKQWDEFVEHFRRDALEKIAGSGAFISLYNGEVDVKFAVELGTAILLDKPILAITGEGVEVSEKFRAVADVVVAADPDTSDGQEGIRQAVLLFLAQHAK